MPGKLLLSVTFGQIAANARGDRQALDQARDVAVVETFGSDLASDDRPEQGPARDARELQPGLKRGDRTGGVRRAAADLDLAPAGFPTQSEEHALLEKFRPARPFERDLGAHDQAGDFRSAQAASEAEEEDRTVAQISEVRRGQEVEHRQDMIRQERLLLDGRLAMGSP